MEKLQFLIIGVDYEENVKKVKIKACTADEAFDKFLYKNRRVEEMYIKEGTEWKKIL